MPTQPKSFPAVLIGVLRDVDFGHHLESLAITFTVSVVQTLLVFGLRVDSWMHETANFLRHYESASDVARIPINLVLAIGFTLNLLIVVIARRPKQVLING